MRCVDSFLSFTPSFLLLELELTSGYIQQHEDTHLSPSGLSFNSLMASCFPPNPPPVLSRLALPGQGQPQEVQERTVTVDDVLKALDEALRWIEGEQEDGEGGELEELRVRVAMRIVRSSSLLLSSFPRSLT
jgi:hypothetical protein